MHGHSLFELLIVLAVIAFVAALAPPVFSGSRANVEARALAQSLNDTLRLARLRAIAGNKEAAVIIDPAAGRYRTSEDAGWSAIPKSLSLRVAIPTNFASDDAAATLYYPDGSSTGGEVRIESKK